MYDLIRARRPQAELRSNEGQVGKRKEFVQFSSARAICQNISRTSEGEGVYLFPTQKPKTS